MKLNIQNGGNLVNRLKGSEAEHKSFGTSLNKMRMNRPTVTIGFALPEKRISRNIHLLMRRKFSRNAKSPLHIA